MVSQAGHRRETCLGIPPKSDRAADAETVAASAGERITGHLPSTHATVHGDVARCGVPEGRRHGRVQA